MLGGLVCIELVLGGYFYFWGDSGYKKIAELHELHHAIELAVAQVQREVTELEKSIYDIKTYPYYKEKIVREQLQMLRPDEVIYKRP